MLDIIKERSDSEFEEIKKAAQHRQKDQLDSPQVQCSHCRFPSQFWHSRTLWYSM